MLEQLIAANGDQPAQLADMMAQLGQRDPRMAMLMQMMQSRAEAVTTVLDDQDRSDREELVLRLAETEEALAVTRAKAGRILAAYRGAQERLADLAAALGACGLCWGEDDSCPSCRGRGHVGMIKPDKEIRVRLLGPSRTSMPHAEQFKGH